MTLVEALDRLGVPEPAARQALARSANRGLITAERVGRRTRWSLTQRACRLLADGAERIYTFGIDEPAWDGAWLLVLVTVPEHNRHLRARLRTRMAWLGLGSLAPGAWITPWAGRESGILATLDELGLAYGAVSWVGRPGALGAVEARAAEIWDLGSVAEEYAAFQRSIGHPRPGTPAEAFAALTGLVHQWRRFPALDPGLPLQLLPRSWPSAAAARAFHAAHDAWYPDALGWWRERAGR